MSYLTDIVKKATQVVRTGREVLKDQLSSRVTYDATTGKVETTGPKIKNTAKEFFFPNRGFSDAQIKAAQPNTKEKFTGAAKAVGEIAQGGLTLTHMLGNKIADTILPGYDAEAQASKRNALNEKVTEKLKPKTVGEAKVMRIADVAGFIPVGSVSKVSKWEKVLDIISDTAENSLKKDTSSIREKSIEYFRNSPEKIKEGEVRLREIEDGKIVIEDGRHRIQAGIETGVTPKIVDVTAEYTGKPSEKVAQLIAESKKATPTSKQVPIRDGQTGRMLGSFTDEPVRMNRPGAMDITPKGIERAYSKRASEMMPENKSIGSTYAKPRNTTELTQKAQNLWKDNPAVAKRFVDEIKDGGEGIQINEKHIAIASERLNEINKKVADMPDGFDKDVLYEEAAELANATAKRLTEMGRGVQAASILNKLTPAGMVKFAAKEIQKYNLKNPLNKIPELSGKQAKEIGDKMEAVRNMPDGTEKKIAMFNLQKEISKLIPSSKLALVQNFWKAGLLTGIKTSGLNIASNAAHFTMERLKEIPASGVDVLASVFTGKRTNVLTTKGFLTGAKEGWQKGFQYLKTGFDERNIGDKLDLVRVNYGDSKMGKIAQAYTDTVFRIIGAQDQPFYYATLRMSLSSQASAIAKNAGLKGKELAKQAEKLAKNPTDEMLRYALIDATTVVFQNKTILGKQAKRLQEIAGVGQFVVPFAQTPSSVAMQIINYSPVGIVKTIIENAGKGKFDQRLFSQGLGRGIVGTAPLAIGAALYQNGLISLDYPVGDERQIELDKAEGKTYNSIKIGDEWNSAMVLGPAGNLVLIGAYFQKSFEENGSPTQAMAEAGLGALDSFLEQTFVKGIGQFVDAVQEPKKFLTSYLPNLVGSFVPTLPADIAKSLDGQERNSNSQDFWGNFITKPQARIPGLRDNLQPQITTLGEEVPLPEGPIRTAIDPRRPSDDRSTETTRELRRLTDAGYAVSPTKVGDKIGYKSLDESENTQLWKIVGTLTEKTLTNLFQNEKYQKLSDEKKADMISKFVDKSKNIGRAKFIIQATDGLSREERKNLLKKYGEDGLLTEQVFTEYKKLLSSEVQ